MKQTETPEERKKRLQEQLEKARETRKKNAELRRQAKEAGDLEALEALKPKRKRPRDLAKVIREILDDEEIIDLVVPNQPEFWDKLPTKNPNYVIATVMAIKAMSGDQKAADFLAKRGWGDKVVLDGNDGFFDKSNFTIQVVPSKHLKDGIDSQDVLSAEIQQIEE